MRFRHLLIPLLIHAASLPVLAELKVGTAAVKITPPNGAPMAGYYSARLSTGVHDDLWAKAIVLDVDGNRAALVSLDLITTAREMVEEARREVEKSTSIRGENMMIGATHSHTGPVIVSRSTRDGALGGSADIARRYNAELPGKIAQAVKEAESRLGPARALAGIGQETGLAFNRRFHMKDGSVGWNPGKLNPNISRPAGPIDPDVGVLYFESSLKKPLAAYVNFAMHLDTVGGQEISADYPYTLAKILADAKSPDMLTMFALGCCGNINHIDVSSAERQQGHGEAARIGGILAGSVLKTMRSLEPLRAAALRTRSEIVKLPLAPYDAADLEEANETARRFGTKEQSPFLQTVNAFKILDVAARKGRPHEVEVQVVALGDETAFVSLPGEIFVELGLAIKKASPFKYTFIAELANGSIGYIPDRTAYPEGNYEVVSARCAQGSGEILVDAAVRLLRSVFAPSKR